MVSKTSNKFELASLRDQTVEEGAPFRQCSVKPARQKAHFRIGEASVGCLGQLVNHRFQHVLDRNRHQLGVA